MTEYLNGSTYSVSNHFKNKIFDERISFKKKCNWQGNLVISLTCKAR